ncbi:enoyl-CoA hydratase [Bacillus aerolatus]|uniref:Enoyl-CoA hydratase n=1 Tax=Bacillus aerolatus TaxID=2653354 RepID=A0A6I1FIY4_9BACI|nr:enoyl-CoA hydratase-related protein [Bacillus aerolatus]KAB7705646.1 enoyl-CoA hydratase [Bacillus aerolatus]
MRDLEFEIQNHIGIIRLNRPESSNAFSHEMIRLWIDALKEIRDNDDIYVGVLTGNGNAFCAGGDIKAMMNDDGFMAKTRGEIDDFTNSPLDVKNSLRKHIQRIPLLMEEIDKPMIAAINGAAIGAGLDMALMCDIRYCSNQAKLGEGYVKAGIVPGDGGGYYLPRIVGIDKALELLWTGKILTATEAKVIGLVSHIVPHNRLLEEVLDFANELTQAPQEVIRMTKRIVYDGLTLNLKQSLDMVSSFMAIAVHHPDHAEAVSAMREKRKPQFQNQMQRDEV